MMYEGDPECDHDWEKVESDDYITWRCRKCPARAVEEARQRLDATVSL